MTMTLRDGLYCFTPFRIRRQGAVEAIMLNHGGRVVHLRGHGARQGFCARLTQSEHVNRHGRVYT